MPDRGAELEKLVDAVRAGAKYRCVCADLIRGIGARELAKRRNLREAVKATKNALHQAAGAYLGGGIDYSAGLERLRQAAQSADPAEWQGACARLMSGHSSTRERLPILNEFYTTTLADLAPIHTVLDLACGLNPLSIPWMPLAPDAEYHAYDIYEDMAGFLNEFMPLARVHGHARVADLTHSCPPQKADVALLLKSLPCLEQIDSACPLRLMDAVNANHILVSFPIHSLGGKQKGMRANYEDRFRELLGGRRWSVERFEFATELAFRVTR